MKTRLEAVLPEDIERSSFALIDRELPHAINPERAPIVKRVVHTTADFEFVDALCFSDGVVTAALDTLKNGATIVTDTNMARSGISKKALERLNCRAVCFIADEDVAAAAKQNGTTRAAAAMEKAAKLTGPLIFAIGNAPTALIRLHELIMDGSVRPELIIGVPVGFVNVVWSKEMIMQAGVPYIVARGRKGGSPVAAAIVNALMYEITRKKIAG